MRCLSSIRPHGFHRVSGTFLLWGWVMLCLAVGAQGQDAAGRTKRFLAGRRGGAAALAAARGQHAAMAALPRTTNLGAAWSAVGPAQVASALYGNATGRVSSIAIDPADSTGNTVYVGTTGGGVWKSTNAAGAVGAVVFTPLTDTLPVFATNNASATVPSLSIGALAIGNGVLLAGTGDPNDATDSYYGSGVLRSTDGGVTWTLVQQTTDAVSHARSFVGVGFAGLAFSSVNPAVVVAALTSTPEGELVNAADAVNAAVGLYYSVDAGATWQTATVLDGAQTEQMAGVAAGNSATAVTWNPVRGRFYAAVQFHGYYESADGVTWTRLANQPGVGLTAAACPPSAASVASSQCPIFRGALAVQAASGDMFALTVDSSDRETGLYQDVCARGSAGCANGTVLFSNALNGAPLEVGSGSTVIPQADYDLSLAAVASGNDTVLYAGTVDLYRCTLAGGCVLRNTTNAQNGCTNPAGVAAAQHAIAALGGLVYLGNDGGLYRSTDGVNETGSACSLSDAGHFQNLNRALGSLGEVVSFAQDPVLPGTLLVGLGALGSAGSSSASGAWPQLSAGEGGTVAIDASAPLNWYLSTGAGVEISRCSKGSSCTAADFAATTIGAAQVGNDPAATHAPWLLDPQAAGELVVGTCRVWRGSASSGGLWSSSNAIAAPFATPAAASCAATAPVVRSLGAGGPGSGSTALQNAGAEVLYAGLAGSQDGGGTLGGHLFATTAAQLATNATAWTDAAKAKVTNDTANAGLFNPGGFDISSIAVDAHDATGNTVYVTMMGFAMNQIAAPRMYRSVDAGAHWTNVSANLPNAPANSVVVDPNDANTVYIALDAGVYVTTQIGTCASANCWSVYGISLPNAPVVQLAAAAGMSTGDGRLGELRAATYGRGIWQIPLVTAISPAAPVMTISPLTFTYSAQPVGTASASVTVTVTNSGNAVLNVSSVVTTGDFGETDTCARTAVAAGSSCTVQVAFLPTAIGTRTGVLTVYGNVAGGQATVALSGVGTAAAAIMLTPAALTFPGTTVGATSAVQSVTIANTGGTVATISSITVTGDFGVSANSCGGTVSPGTSCTVSIAFTPAASGTRSGTLTVVDSVGTQVASLVGVGTSPATDTLTPVSLSFGPQQMGTGSALQQVTLTNVGDVALGSIAATIGSGDFTVVSGCGVSLNAHSSCVLSVGFVPKSVGSQSGVLTIADSFRSQSVSLSGVGIAPPGVSLSPSNGIAFVSTGVGLSSSVQTVTLTNNGGVVLSLASVTASGDFQLAAGANTCGAAVAPAAVCTVGVVFSPAAVGARSGVLAFVDNAGSSPQTVVLSGVGVDFALAVNGPSSQMLASGGSVTYSLLLSSAAGVPGSVPFTCSGVPAHSTCTVNPASGTLGGSQVVTVTLTTGVATAALEPGPLPWKMLVVAGLVGFGLLRRRRLRVLLLVGLVGCSAGRTVPFGGSGSAPVVTPSGSYNLLVAGSSAGLVRSVGLTVVVQ